MIDNIDEIFIPRREDGWVDIHEITALSGYTLATVRQKAQTLPGDVRRKYRKKSYFLRDAVLKMWGTRIS